MEVVEGELAALGLEVYSQNFSATKLVSTDSKVRVLQVLTSLDIVCVFVCV